ncbi:MAG: fibronectin type III domain-containing protein [Oscillospiraceae bacterium]|nr:fibronectin type III domain-containing protein [Oscillospiraceae bacterium]
MKNKIIYVSIIILSLMLSSCDTQPSLPPETETTAEITANTQSTETVSVTVTESAKTEITTSAESITSQTETATSQIETVTSQTETLTSLIETELVYDKTTPPVLTVSNIDYKTNDMSWTAVEGAQTYMLYILNEQTGEFEEYGEIEGTSCKDINLTPNTKYTYSVAAKFNDGSFGKMSEAADIYTYSLYASNVQGDWVYAYEYNDEKEKAKI